MINFGLYIIVLCSMFNMRMENSDLSEYHVVQLADMGKYTQTVYQHANFYRL